MSENEGYGDGEYSVDGDDQLPVADTLEDRGVDDILDEGYSPPEKYSVLERFGNTAREEREGESLDQRLSEEVPDPNLAVDDPLEDAGRDPEDERTGVDGDLDLDSRIDEQVVGDEFDGEVGRRASRPAGQPGRGRARGHREGPGRRRRRHRRRGRLGRGGCGPRRARGVERRRGARAGRSTLRAYVTPAVQSRWRTTPPRRHTA